MTEQENKAIVEEEEKYFASITKRARLLYNTLPNVGFSLTTFEELGRSSQRKIAFETLSAPLRGALIRLVAMFDEGVKNLEVEDAVKMSESSEDVTAVATAEGESEPKKEEAAGEEDEEDEEDEEVPPVEDTEPAAPPSAPEESPKPAANP